EEGVLHRIIFEPRFSPTQDDRESVLLDCRHADLQELIEKRNQLIDDLVEDAADRQSVFGSEFSVTMEKLTGLTFVSNSEFCFREWWDRSREKCTGQLTLIWLVIRLWEAQCLQAAEIVAERTGDVMLAETAKLSRMLDEAPDEEFDLDRFVDRARSFCVFPDAADQLEVLQLDSPFASLPGHETVPDQLELRVAMVDLLTQIQSEYAEGDCIEPRWLLFHLTGCDRRTIRSMARFHAWWKKIRAVEWDFDERMAAGLRAAEEEEWEEAEQAFAEAQQLCPPRAAGPYNRALVLIQMERLPEAEDLLENLVRESPDKPDPWKWLGDCRRKLGRNQEALEAYHKASELGEEDEELALRIALTMDLEGDEEAAATMAISALGDDADALEEAASILESEGAYQLALRLREHAFRQGLDPFEPE
ncbi:MAG: hypothetical protein N2C14_09295, partial [Planctomycetales bacterium]